MKARPQTNARRRHSRFRGNDGWKGVTDGIGIDHRVFAAASRTQGTRA